MFDFSGTGPQLFGNLNAPRAVTYSAVIYCLRCMVGHDIPLNQGCLEPVTIKVETCVASHIFVQRHTSLFRHVLYCVTLSLFVCRFLRAAFSGLAMTQLLLGATY